jgi:hypothetical protein
MKKIRSELTRALAGCGCRPAKPGSAAA